MIVWLASYPRSGNTLLRIILYRSFGLHTFSLYEDSDDVGVDPILAKLVGHRSRGMAPEDFKSMARTRPDPFFVKTHGESEAKDDAKAIYVVRDGRAAVASYFHYRKDIVKEDVSLAQVVKGDVWSGGWSDHVHAWVFSDRPNTLVVKFEDLVAENAETLDRIADFIALPILARSSIAFDQLQAVAPAFFRKGSSANAAELDAGCSELFWSLHGETMIRLGYVTSMPANISPAMSHNGR